MKLKTTHIDGYDWIETCLRNEDRSLSSCDLEGNEIIVYPNLSYKIIPGGFANKTGLKFYEPDGVELLVLREMKKEYKLDTMAELIGLNKDMLVLDLGAHVGVVSMYLAVYYGCKVEAYEPAPCNYKRLVENVRINKLGGLITPYNLAVTKDGLPVMVGGTPEENTGGMSIYRNINATPCDSITLGDVIGGRHIDLLKIDCEGAEYEILEDLSPLVNVSAIIGEFHKGYNTRPDDLYHRIQPIVPKIRITIQ